MKYTKEEIEKQLHDGLDELLSAANQEGTIRSLVYDEETQTCIVTFAVVIIPEDNYIGFAGY